jgi:hypothetical protein
MKRACTPAEGGPERVCIVHHQSEANDNDRWIEIEFTPTSVERLLLDAYAYGSPFRPTYHRGPHAAHALASWIVDKHARRKSWREGDPTEEHEDEIGDFLDRIACDETRGDEDEELASAVRAAVRKRAEAFEARSSWMVRTGFLDLDLWADLLGEYVTYLKDLAKGVGKADHESKAHAERAFKENPEWRSLFLRLHWCKERDIWVLGDDEDETERAAKKKPKGEEESQ